MHVCPSWGDRTFLASSALTKSTIQKDEFKVNRITEICIGKRNLHLKRVIDKGVPLRTIVYR